MGHRAGRIVCQLCGANNFDTVSACWKCSAPLGAGAVGSAASSPPFASRPPLPQADSFGSAGASPSMAYRATGNPAAANRAAMWLGLLFPYFGLPIGLAFIMCDDRRRQEVGRLCILWSLLSGAIHLLLLLVALLGMRAWLEALLPALRGQLGRPGGLGGGLGGGELP